MTALQLDQVEKEIDEIDSISKTEANMKRSGCVS